MKEGGTEIIYRKGAKERCRPVERPASTRPDLETPMGHA
jgi:hypothetical protein